MTFKPRAKKQLAKVRTAHAAILVQIADKEAARNTALLAGAEAAAIATIDDELATLQYAARTESDRIKLLEAEAEKEEGLARAKRRDGLIADTEAKIAERDKVAAELQDTLDRAAKLFKRTYELGNEVSAMWQWKDSDRFAIALAGVELKRLVMHHLYRVGTVPNPLGGLPFDRQAPAFPGGLCPKIELRLTPEKIPSLVDSLRERARYAAKVLRGGKPSPERTDAAPERTAAEAKLAALLARQAVAAEDISEAGEREYKQITAELVALDAEIQQASRTKTVRQKEEATP